MQLRITYPDGKKEVGIFPGCKNEEDLKEKMTLQSLYLKRHFSKEKKACSIWWEGDKKLWVKGRLLEMINA